MHLDTTTAARHGSRRSGRPPAHGLSLSVLPIVVHVGTQATFAIKVVPRSPLWVRLVAVRLYHFADGAFARVRALVAGEVATPRAREIALVALVRLLASVRPLVAGELATLRARVLALVALERLLARAHR